MGRATTRRGCGVHHLVATTNSTHHSTISSATAHHGATSPLAAYRKNAAAMPIMPMNGHTGVACGLCC